MDYIYLGKRIREERLKAHLTQEQMAIDVLKTIFNHIDNSK